MMSISIGKSLKNLDKITIPSDVIFTIFKDRIPGLIDTLARMISDLQIQLFNFTQSKQIAIFDFFHD